MTYSIAGIDQTTSFTRADTFVTASIENGEGRFFLGKEAGRAYLNASEDASGFSAIELELECLGVYTDVYPSDSRRNTLGFARFRMGDAEPSQLIELVRNLWTSEEAVAAVKRIFETHGYVVAVCQDVPGRIVNTLIRPYLNAALRRLDEQLATAEDLDMTLCLGLGYPEGPIALTKRTGLANHYDVTDTLYQATRNEAFAPARQSVVASQRRKL